MRALILAHDFPPFVSVGGLRPYSWYRYLREFDVEPVVITRQWANHYGDERDYIAPSATDVVVCEEAPHGTIVRTPYSPNLSNRLLLEHGPKGYRLLRKAITAWYEIGQFHALIGPKMPIYRAARDYLLSHRIDAIVATGEPFVLLRYAALLSEEFDIPWVADYRDPWSQDKRRAGQRLSRRWEASIERQVTASASVVTTVSVQFRDILAQIHTGKTFEVIPNGYDPEAMAGAAALDQGHERLTIAFVGSVYNWHPIESVLQVVDAFLRSKPDAAFAMRMIGVSGWHPDDGELQEKFPSLAPHLTFTPAIPNNEIAVELANANVFLMFNNYGYPGTKVYDYLALKRQILLCYSDDAEATRLKRRYYNLELHPGTPEDVLETMLRDSSAGVTVKDSAHLGEVLTNLYREFERSGAIACSSVGTEQYSRRAQAGRLAEVLKGLAK